MGPERDRIDTVTGAILAGGKSRRMGVDKALLPYRRGNLIEAIYSQIGALFAHVMVVGSMPERYDFLPCRKVTDIHRGFGALGGIHAALVNSETPLVFATACDMPYLVDDLVRLLCSKGMESDVVVPEGDRGLEPLHAIYSKSALDAIERAIGRGERQVISIFPELKVTKITRAEVTLFDPHFRSFVNVNTPEDYRILREMEEGKPAEDRGTQ